MSTEGVMEAEKNRAHHLDDAVVSGGTSEGQLTLGMAELSEGSCRLQPMSERIVRTRASGGAHNIDRERRLLAKDGG